MTKVKKTLIAITMGDPAGIGPEVTAKALGNRQVQDSCLPFVVGSADAMTDALCLVGAKELSARVTPSPGEVTEQQGTVWVLDYGNLEYGDIAQGQLSAAAGRASVEWVLKAGELAASGQVGAIVTAPINKEAGRLAGYTDIGHMELLQSQTGATQVATMLVARTLRTVHLTTHRSLRVACDYVTRENILAKTELTNECFRKWGFPSPKIAVAALNPHASDGGLLGDEEERQIAPAVEEARARGIDAIGPVPADIVFTQAIEGRYDAVLAMYHDQGHIPVKVHDFAGSFSVTLGLPFIRTSVDHGTAFDIAGEGIASEASMLEALRVAVNLASGNGLR